MSLFSLPLTLYKDAMRKHPMLARSAIISSLLGVGDVIIQLKSLDDFKSYNPKQTLRKMGIGLLILGPSMFLWQCKVLPKFKKCLARYLVSSEISIKLLKTAVDTTAFSIFNAFVFLSLYGSFEYGSLRKGVANAQANCWRLFKEGWIFWPPVTLINFFWVLPIYRVIFMSSMGVFWNLYIYEKLGREAYVAKEEILDEIISGKRKGC